MTKHIAVLMGGWSAEREVSLSSGKAVTDALMSLGHKVTPVDMAPGLPMAELVAQLVRLKPDVVFNALHGRFGEDGTVQGMLDLLKIPYTHSGVLASALAMDKPMAKRLFESYGLRCPRGVIVQRGNVPQGDPLPRPYVIKPANEGSSVGVHIVTEQDNRTFEMIVANEETPRHSPLATSHYLVEEYIAGREITSAILNDRALGVTELVTSEGFYDYQNKYTPASKTKHICPAPLPPAKYQEAMDIALAAHRALGCRGLSRADFRYDDTKGDGVFYLLEVNTQPGMTALSLSPELARHAGIEFPQLVQMLVDGAAYGN